VIQYIFATEKLFWAREVRKTAKVSFISIKDQINQFGRVLHLGYTLT